MTELNNIPPSETPPWLIVLIPLAFFIVFPLFWCFVIWIISQAGGWRRLASRYQTTREPEGKLWPGLQGSIGVASYRGCLDATTNQDGIFLQPNLLFRFAHPRLFIPWSEFHEARRSTILWYQFVSARIGNPGVARIRLPLKVIAESDGKTILPPANS